MTPRRNDYLYQKQQHALYLRGKLKFRIVNLTRSLLNREKDSPLIALSSESAKHEFLPGRSAKARATRFTSSLWTAKLDERPQDAVGEYHLPKKYALVSTQLWLHKNHKILPAALSIARKKGLKIPLVMTGVPADYRDPENQILSNLLQDFARRGLAGQVHFLGKLPFPDLISITRCATVIVQPSQCEGWDTLIEDAKALGRPIICSDTDVHREQAPSALGHFSHLDPDGLSKILLDHFPDLEPGPCLSLEAEMLALSRMRARDFGNLVPGCAREIFEQKQESHLATPRRNNYLYQKQQHALYLWGKLRFRIVHFARSLEKREEDSPLIARLMQRLDDGYSFDYWKLSAVCSTSLSAGGFPPLAPRSQQASFPRYRYAEFQSGRLGESDDRKCARAGLSRSPLCCSRWWLD